MVKRDESKSIVFPRFEYFDRLTNKWIAPVREPSWEDALATPTHSAWEDASAHPTHSSWEDALVPYHTSEDAPASPEYHIGELYSSHMENESVPQEWAPWGQLTPYYDDGSQGWGSSPNT
jgi:hypothetical protein